MRIADEIQYRIAAGGPPSAKGPGSGHYDHKGSFAEQMHSNLKVMSRTSQGISRTADRPALTQEGDRLAQQAAKNFQNGIDWIWQHKDDDMDSGPKVRKMIESIADIVSNALLQPGQSKWRTWEDKKNGYTPVANMQKFLNKFSRSLSSRITNKEDPKETAAWVEKEFQHVHPLADGVGRATMLLAAFVLARAGHALPQYRDRKEHFQQIESKNWPNYYRGLFSHAAS